MILKVLFPIVMLIALSIESYKAFKNDAVDKFFNFSMIWTGIALVSFCFSVMMFTVLEVILGLVLGLICFASIYISMKFKNAVKTT
ncbi:hypothetical protein XM47_09340 [Catenovulum maritimum]|uniref:Uncharacterized protein n=1 Tax=Catenovulum maritimum TaxID=1513271 RepID=A0A0J8GVA6_9ALTE|nr:hypothetical protein XM47_09340 [Catenovulum maritimum]